MTSATLRAFVRRLHLALALVFGGVFAVSGLTGCALAWMHELDSFLNPGLFHAAGHAAPLSPAAVQRLVDRLAATPAYGRPTMLTLPERPGEVAVAWYRLPARGAPGPFALDKSRQVMVDPDSLAVTGERVWGEIGLSRPLLMPTLFHLHRYLLAGQVGKTVVGIAGLALVLLTGAGIVLWWPRASLAAWRRAFRIVGGSWPRFNVSSHRAAGAVLAPVLLMLGFSGALFNVPQWVTPAVALVLPVTTPDKPPRAAAPGRPSIPVAQAVAAAQAAFSAARISRVTLPAKPGQPYEIRARQPGELRQGDGDTRLTLDAATGAILRVRDPLRARGGDAFLGWQFPLHSGEAFGTPGRWLMSVVGLAPPAFLVTGIAVWLRRRAGRRRSDC